MEIISVKSFPLIFNNFYNFVCFCDNFELIDGNGLTGAGITSNNQAVDDAIYSTKEINQIKIKINKNLPNLLFQTNLIFIKTKNKFYLKNTFNETLTETEIPNDLNIFKFYKNDILICFLKDNFINLFYESIIIIN